MSLAVTMLLDLSLCVWITLGILIVFGYYRGSLYDGCVLQYYLVSTGMMIVLATLLRYVRMEE